MTTRYPEAAESWGVRLMCELSLNRYTEAKASLIKLKRALNPEDKRYQNLISFTEETLKSQN
jgi:hypothetical protein